MVAYTCYRVHDMNREESLAARAYGEYKLWLQFAEKINSALVMGGGFSK
jgi:hypothetical protein